jgi:hypothetical protein
MVQVRKFAFASMSIPAALLIFGSGRAHATQTISEVGVLACVNDKWDEKELEKGHKLVDYAGRCIRIPSDAAEPKDTADCVGRYEYMPDESWKGSGTCTWNLKSGDKQTEAWEEGSQLKEYPYRWTGGTGKYEGVKGGGTYIYENLTDTLSAGTYKGKMELPDLR